MKVGLESDDLAGAFDAMLNAYSKESSKSQQEVSKPADLDVNKSQQEASRPTSL